MADNPQTKPVFELDDKGNVTHLHGTVLPGGLINAGAGISNAKQFSAVQSDRVVIGAYAFAERLIAKLPSE